MDSPATPGRAALDRPGLIGTMSFRLAIAGGLPSDSARFRFTSHAQNALQWSCRSRIFQRTANSVLFDCLSAGVHPTHAVNGVMGSRAKSPNLP